MNETTDKTQANLDELRLLADSYGTPNLCEFISRQPVVLTYIDGDSYGGDAMCWPGVGMPYVITFDGGRYDKYNRMDGDNPYEDWRETLDELAKINEEACSMLREWVEQAAEACGILSDQELAEWLRDKLNGGMSEEDAIKEMSTEFGDYFDVEQLMGEHDCLPIGDIDCDVIDLCNGFRLTRQPRPRRSQNQTTRRWRLEHYTRD